MIQSPEDISGAGFSGKEMLVLRGYGHTAVPGGQKPNPQDEYPLKPKSLPNEYNLPTLAFVLPPNR